MILVTEHHDFHYETANICRFFVPDEKIKTVKEHPAAVGDELLAVTTLCESDTGAKTVCRLQYGDFCEMRTNFVPADSPHYRDDCERTLATDLYHLFCTLFETTQSWGILTGVRPIKLLRRTVNELGLPAALDRFRNVWLCDEQKLSLAQKTLTRENEILSLSRPDSFSLYVSIPFCPTRCDYCSFVSHTVDRAAYLIPDYLRLLCEEIRETARIASRLGLRLETVYVGGGTPTTLDAAEMATLLSAISEAFDLSNVREFTVEAGRPDTVTEEKLRAIKQAGIERVSINPQTLHDPVLAAIGRKHTVEDFYNAYDLARQVGFAVINTDLITGLPTDTVDGFAKTLDGILALSPENVTVHTLSMKHGSNLVASRRFEIAQKTAEAKAMSALSVEKLTAAGYDPYYLYRQGRTMGNQENVGWAKPGCEGLYNVYIMDETHTILGCGAGAVSKLKQPNGEYIERIFNYKFPYEYVSGFPEMLARKAGIDDFYTRFPIQN